MNICPTTNIISERLKLISLTSGSNAKKDLISLKFGDPIQTYFIRFLDYVLNEVKYTYNLRKIPEYNLITPKTKTIDDLFKLLDIMSINSGGEEIKELVTEFVNGANDHLYTLFTMCIERNLDCGIEVETVAKLFPELDHLISPYMRCEKEDMLDKRIVYPAAAQIKADGLFINIFTGNFSENISPRFITRYGNEAIIEGSIVSVIAGLTKYVPEFAHRVIHGEFLVLDDNGNILPREVGNGLINSYIKRFKTIATAEKKIAQAKTENARIKLENELRQKIEDWDNLKDRLIIKYWDMITEEEFKAKKSNIEYQHRVQVLNKTLEAVFQANKSIIKYLRPIETRIVYSKDELLEFYQEALDMGEEGLVVKNLTLLWQHNATRGGMIKLKDFNDCDLVCIGYNPGEGEYNGGIGSLICRSSDNIVKVDPSSGLSMNQRGLQRVDMNDSSKGWEPIPGFDLDQYKGKIIAVKFNTLLQEDENNYSLFLPKIVEVRESFDKQTADDIEEIKKSSKGKK